MTYHQEKPKCIKEGFRRLRARVRFLNRKAARSQDDGEGKPKAAVGGKGGSTEGVAHGHFPARGAFVSTCDLGVGPDVK